MQKIKKILREKISKKILFLYYITNKLHRLMVHNGQEKCSDFIYCYIYLLTFFIKIYHSELVL